MAPATKLANKYQISSPKEVRESQNWKPGREFAFIPRGGGYVFVPAPTLDELYGIAKGANPDGYRDRNDRS